LKCEALALKTSGLGLVLTGLGLGLDTVGLVNITAMKWSTFEVRMSKVKVTRRYDTIHYCVLNAIDLDTWRRHHSPPVGRIGFLVSIFKKMLSFCH